ncbi:30S ribosomal protein S2, partial [Bacillus tropicus]|uniref:30S ribosomal protein S2 n=1 Tax=Bacillus tropicus TaxID=2026188 RepID=UPI0034D9761F
EHRKERIAEAEERKLHIEIVGNVDRKCDTDENDHGKTENDETNSAEKLLTEKMTEAILKEKQGEEKVTA